MKRYIIVAGDGPAAYEIEDEWGQWVRYEDAAALLRRCRRYVLTPGLYVDDEAEYAELVRAIDASLEGK